MSSEKEHLVFDSSSDRPLTNPIEDKLGYSPFAKNIANSICTIPSPEGFVIGLSGPWGTGKTSVINFIQHYIKEKPEEDQPIIITFNPWWFSGQEDLTRRFFDQVLSVFKGKKFISKDFRNMLADFADAISNIPIPPITIIPGVENAISKTMGKSLERLLRHCA